MLPRLLGHSVCSALWLLMFASPVVFRLFHSWYISLFTPFLLMCFHFSFMSSLICLVVKLVNYQAGNFFLILNITNFVLQISRPRWNEKVVRFEAQSKSTANSEFGNWRVGFHLWLQAVWVGCSIHKYFVLIRWRCLALDFPAIRLIFRPLFTAKIEDQTKCLPQNFSSYLNILPQSVYKQISYGYFVCSYYCLPCMLFQWNETALDILSFTSKFPVFLSLCRCISLQELYLTENFLSVSLLALLCLGQLWRTCSCYFVRRSAWNHSVFQTTV